MSHHNRLDFPTGNCGASVPTLVTRSGSMAAHGRPSPSRFHATHCERVTRLRRAWRPDHARHTDSPNVGAEVQARPPVKTTATSIRSGPADRPPAAIRMKVAKRFSGPSMNPRTAPQTGVSRQNDLPRRHRLPSRPDLPGRRHRRTGSTTGCGWGSPSRPADRPPDRRFDAPVPANRLTWREPMTARACPID